MWYEDLDRLMPVLMLAIMAALLRAAYEFSRPADTGWERLASTTTSQPSEPEQTGDLTPQQQPWAEKADHKYAAAQKKKWQRWTKSMFEPK